MFGLQLYKNNARVLLSRILSILNLDWLQHARSYELNLIHTLRVHYAHAEANLNSGYSKCAKVARVHFFFVQLHSEHLVQC